MHQTLNFGGPQNFQPFVGPRHLPKFLVHIVFRLKKKKIAIIIIIIIMVTKDRKNLELPSKLCNTLWTTKEGPQQRAATEKGLWRGQSTFPHCGEGKGNHPRVPSQTRPGKALPPFHRRPKNYNKVASTVTTSCQTVLGNSNTRRSFLGSSLCLSLVAAAETQSAGSSAHAGAPPICIYFFFFLFVPCLTFPVHVVSFDPNGEGAFHSLFDDAADIFLQHSGQSPQAREKGKKKKATR